MQNLKKTKIEQKFKERGITLIALIITIIVLLILAGVALATLTGDSGILTNSQKAKENTELANLKEEVSIKLMENKLQTEKTLKEKLEEIGSVTPIGEDTFYVTKGNTTLTVYENGDIVEGKALWDGKSSESPEFKEVGEVFNWYIYTPAQLKYLADYVNSGKVLTETQKEQLTAAGYNPEDVTLTEDTTVYLMNDLDLGAREVNGEWETEANEKVEWIPIGKEKDDTKDNTLVATFEGNGNTIRGVYVNTDTKFNGIFGNSHSIKNLTIENSYIKGANCTAGIVGAVRGGTVENCHNINTTVTLIEGEYVTVAGVVGQLEGTVLRCSNTGKIIAIGMNSKGNSQAGGVVGAANTSATIDNCYNTGKVTGNGKCIGGVVGYAHTFSTVSNCYNTAEVTGNVLGVGGVVGYAHTFSTVSNCYNTAEVTGNVLGVGGVIGFIYNNSTVSDCYNTGKVTGNGERIGGVVGEVNPSSTVINCYNTAEVTGNVYVGGTIGNIHNNSTVSDCYNTGKVTGNGERIGGVVGNMNSSVIISKCYNTGSVNGEESTGGIVGVMAQVSTTLVTNSKVEKCYNSGSVNGEEGTGGIVGRISGDNGQGTVIQCYNKGQVTGTTNVGAVIGEQANTTGLNTLNHLYYINTVGIEAISGVNDNEENKIMSTTENIISFKRFLEWIEKQIAKVE